MNSFKGPVGPTVGGPTVGPTVGRPKAGGPAVGGPGISKGSSYSFINSDVVNNTLCSKNDSQTGLFSGSSFHMLNSLNHISDHQQDASFHCLNSHSNSLSANSLSDTQSIDNSVEYDPLHPDMTIDADANPNHFASSLKLIQQNKFKALQQKDAEIYALREKIKTLENELITYRAEKAAQTSFFERDMTSRCPAAFSNEIPRESYVCKNCGVPGHFIQNCPQKKRPPIGYVCKNCFDSSRDHFLNECPHPKQKRQCFNISPTI